MILELVFDFLFCCFLLYEFILQFEIVEFLVVVFGYQYKKSKFFFLVYEFLCFLLNICFFVKKYYLINLKLDIVYKMIFEYVLFMVMRIYIFVYLLLLKICKQMKNLELNKD